MVKTWIKRIASRFQTDAPRIETAERDAPDFDADAETVSTLLLTEFNPEDVLHIGCGVGKHLTHFHDNGVTAHGVDPSYISQEQATIPADNILIHDMQEPYRPDTDYDIAMCFDLVDYMEVADNVVETLTHTSDTAIVAPAMATRQAARNTDKLVDQITDLFHERDFTFNEQRSDALNQAIDTDGWVPARLMVFHRNT